VSLLIYWQGFSPSPVRFNWLGGLGSVQLECYEILTNKNDVERRNGVIYKPLNMLVVN
jgi:hypothetical protein